MIKIRKSVDRGHFNHGWLDTNHTFSFADYHDPEHMGFRSLRVINEDFILPGQGFGMHPHSDMEIITYVVSGALEHRDNMGNGSMIRPDEVQRMSAGTGILHSEFNGSHTENVHLLQIWILPEKRGFPPGYEQKPFPVENRTGQLRLIASHDGRDGSVSIHQDVSLFASILNARQELTHEFQKDRSAWIQVIKGSVACNGTILNAGDGASVRREKSLEFFSEEGTEFLLFDLA
jgi:quercetin 2,3-dioxygenase